MNFSTAFNSRSFAQLAESSFRLISWQVICLARGNISAAVLRSIAEKTWWSERGWSFRENCFQGMFGKQCLLFDDAGLGIVRDLTENCVYLLVIKDSRNWRLRTLWVDNFNTDNFFIAQLFTLRLFYDCIITSNKTRLCTTFVIHIFSQIIVFTMFL